MRKEVIIAVLAGFLLGLVITFGVYTANKAIKKQKTEDQANVPTAETEPSPLPSPTPSLEISQPEDNLVVKEDELTLAGQNEPRTPVAILAEGYEDLLYTDSEGLFSTTVPLVGGANEIKLVSLPKNGQKQEKTITVVYTEAEIQ